MPGAIDNLFARIGSLLSLPWTPPGKPRATIAPQHMAQALQDLEQVRRTGHWWNLPPLLWMLSHRDLEVRQAGAHVIGDLVEHIPPAALPGFELVVRRDSHKTYQWAEMQRGEVLATDWPVAIWALFSMHPSGFVREAAVLRLAREKLSEKTLPYLLLRLNDWVDAVCEPAMKAVRSAITTDALAAWETCLGLVARLQRRSRVDHVWLSEALIALFLRPEVRTALDAAQSSRDRDTARWAFQMALRLDVTERVGVLERGLRAPDPIVRFQAARYTRKWMECPERERLLALMRADTSMPIRREALYADLDAPAEERLMRLKACLLDHHASMRHAARVYLRDSSPQGFDARGFYLRALKECGDRPAAKVIAGVGESGTPEDGTGLMRFADSSVPSVANAAVRAVCALDRDAHRAWFELLLCDARPGVVREAARALRMCGHAVSPETLRNVMRTCEHRGSRYHALLLLLNRNPYDALIDAIEAAAGSDDAVKTSASLFIERGTSRNVCFSPNLQQFEAIRSALAQHKAGLDEDLAQHVRALVGIRKK
jgi:hypothetical protein